MFKRWITGAALTALFVLTAAPAHALTAPAPGELAAQASLRQILQSEHRSAEHRARDRYRHPGETLAFFGIRPDMTVVEISPGGSGWYTEILAPLLRDEGLLYAASYDPDSESEYFRRNAKKFSDKLAAKPGIYGKVRVTVFAPPDKLQIAPAGSADMVLTFRNLHGWLGDGAADEVFAAIYRTLKPGGILGLVQHRGDPAKPQDPQAESGYVREDLAIALARKAGFRLEKRSELNANPLDTRDHPEGVWTLPPGLRLKDENRAHYLAIGESDRMTLKFVKPEAP